jgi:ribosomal protein L7Ae-like RNA K-turn-binding protein
VLDLLGLSTRAGAAVFGTDAVRSAVREGGVYQVLLAKDAAEGQQGKLIPLLDARRIPYYIGFSRKELGDATGRAPVSAVGLTNPKLASRMGELITALPLLEDQQRGK